MSGHDDSCNERCEPKKSVRRRPIPQGCSVDVCGGDFDPKPCDQIVNMQEANAIVTLPRRGSWITIIAPSDGPINVAVDDDDHLTLVGSSVVGADEAATFWFSRGKGCHKTDDRWVREEVGGSVG